MSRRRLHLVYGIAILLLSGVLLLTRVDVPSAYQRQLTLATDGYQGFTWLGAPVWQPIPDLWTLQETIAAVKPALLIECGTYKGGSAYFFAQLFDLLNQGRVITVDVVEKREVSHPRVTYLIGDCAGEAIVGQIRAAAAAAGGPVFVVLDSDHSAAHVTRELAAFAPLVTVGSYLHVQDGAVDTLDLYKDLRPGPLVAIEAFLATHSEFVVDEARTTRFLYTHHPKGWLKRIR